MLKQKIHTLTQVTLEQHFIIRALLLPLLFSLYLVLGIVHAAQIIFLPSTQSYTNLYELDPKNGYAFSYTRHIKKQKHFRALSILTFILPISISIAINLIVSLIPR